MRTSTQALLQTSSSHLGLDSPSPTTSSSPEVAPPERWDGINRSGLHPKGKAVLCLAVETDLKTTLIQLPDFVKNRQLILDTEAIVIEIGPWCWHEEPEPRARVGERVILAAMAGSVRVGRDGKAYRFVNDRDIYGGIEDE